MHHYFMESIRCKVYMEGTSSKRNVIDIEATCLKHASIVPELLALHAITGCDTTSFLWGVGKVTAINTLNKDFSLHLLGSNSDLADIVKEATRCLDMCYVQRSREHV